MTPEVLSSYAQVQSLRVSDVVSYLRYRRISLEAGSTPFFEPASNLYAKYGLENCTPLSGDKEDPNSVFMTKELWVKIYE